MTLPKTIFVRVEKSDDDGEDWLNAFYERDEAVDGDGPTVVGEYRLVNTKRLAKYVQVVEK